MSETGRPVTGHVEPPAGPLERHELIRLIHGAKATLRDKLRTAYDRTLYARMEDALIREGRELSPALLALLPKRPTPEEQHALLVEARKHLLCPDAFVGQKVALLGRLKDLIEREERHREAGR